MTLVVHTHLHARRSGVTRHVEDMVRALGGAFDVRLHDGHASNDVVDARLPRIGWKDALEASRRSPVVWHAHRNHELLRGLVLRALGGDLKLVYTRHAATKPSAFTRWCARRADAVVTLTPEMAEVLAVPSVTVPHGVDLAAFSAPPERESAFRALGLPGRFGIGVVGRVRPSKGQGDFVDAIAPLLDTHPDWTPVLVGAALGEHGTWAEELKARTTQRLVLAGEQADVARWYRGFTIVVNASPSEGFSLSFVEAMASGCCVVAARLPHYEALVEHGRTGFFYEPGDVAGLRGLLGELLADPETATRVGAAAAEVARSRFGIENEAAALGTVYRRLVGG